MTSPRRKRAETAATQLKRLLQLIPTLADGEEHPLDELAGLAGTSPAALLADLNALVERYDVPAGWVDGVSITVGRDTVAVRSDHFLRPMRLTMPELCALELGLMMARREHPDAAHAPIDSALARLREAITQLPANDSHRDLRAAVAGAAAPPALLATVRAALRDRRKLRLRYRSGSAEATTERIVCTYGAAFANGAWYAIAHCEQSEGLRFFRFDRIEHAERLEESFERPASFSVDEALPNGRAFTADDAGAMTVRYSPRIARWIAEREGVPVAGDGSLTLDHPLADEEWALRHVLQYGPDAEVVHPPSLRATLAGRLREMAAQSPAEAPPPTPSGRSSRSHPPSG